MLRVEEALASYLSPDIVSSLKAPALPTKPCHTTSALVGRAYMAAGQAGTSLHTMAILQAYQEDLLKDLLKDLDRGEGPTVDDIAELRKAADLSLRVTKETAHAISIAALVTTEWRLCLNLLGIKEKDRAFLLDALFSPSGLFGDAVNAVLDRFQELKKQSVAFRQYLPCRSRSKKAAARGHSSRRSRPQPLEKADPRTVLQELMVFLEVLLSVVLVSGCSEDGEMPADCSDLYKAGQKLSGIYSIYPAGDVPVWVYCHMISDGKDEDNGGWTVIQRRMDGSVNFYRPWNQYKRGFGNVESEYWLGLENMYQLTHNRKYMLRVDLEDFTGRKGFALYSSFSVDCETDGYKLHVSGFKDGGADQDTWENNCAKQYLGAFWYNTCHYANPNGVYLWGEDPTIFAIGNVWYHWKSSHAVGMKSISMKIRRVS
ncbi:unnamed protein product [Leuciscus chuanchicus]